MKLQSFKRLIKEDVDEEYRGLIDKIGYSINLFAQDVINGFNKNLTIADNLNQELKSIDIQVASDGTPTPVTKFKNGLSVSLQGISIVRVENLTNTNSYPDSAVQLYWSEESSVVTIKKVTGLNSNYKYRLKILTIGS